MDSLEEILKVIGGLIFGAIYLFGNQIFKSKDEDQERPPTLPRERGGQGDAEDDAAARQRQIQEAIRRKIMERRQQASEPAAQKPVVQQRERRKEVVERHKETQQRVPHVEPTPVAAEADGRFSWDESDNAYEHKMQERLQAIEATKRRAEALKRQAGAPAVVSESRRSRKRSSAGRSLTGSVRSTLRDPGAARTAFIYGEVLGKPVGVRPSGSGVE